MNLGRVNQAIDLVMRQQIQNAIVVLPQSVQLTLNGEGLTVPYKRAQIFNNVAVGAKRLISMYQAQNILVIDLDIAEYKEEQFAQYRGSDNLLHINLNSLLEGNRIKSTGPPTFNPEK